MENGNNNAHNIQLSVLCSVVYDSYAQ